MSQLPSTSSDYKSRYLIYYDVDGILLPKENNRLNEYDYGSAEFNTILDKVREGEMMELDRDI